MPLVVLCGNPCSGKSTVAEMIQEECSKSGMKAEIISELSLQRVDKNECYRGELNGSAKTCTGVTLWIGWRI